MMGLGMPEIIIIAIIAVLLFGPRQLPKLGKSIGESIREFRNAGKELTKGWTDDQDGDRHV